MRAFERLLGPDWKSHKFSWTRKTSLTSPLGHYRLLSRLYCVNCGRMRFVRSAVGLHFAGTLYRIRKETHPPVEQCLTVHARLTSN